MPSDNQSAGVALVTGGASGIGLSVTERLVEEGWQVTVTDLDYANGIKTAERLGSQVTFLEADVTDYEQLSAVFIKTWEKQQSLDLVFANAGMVDQQDFYESVPDRKDGSPPKPNLVVVDVCLNHVIYAAFLSIHYFRNNKNKVGKFVSTSSMGGLYPALQAPLYSAAKHGVVGLTITLGQRFKLTGEPMTFNCVCPGLVDTRITQKTMIPLAPKDLITPHSTVVKAVMSFIEDESKTGLAAECSVNQTYYRSYREWSDEAAESLMTGKFLNVSRFWEQAWRDDPSTNE